MDLALTQAYMKLQSQESENNLNFSSTFFTNQSQLQQKYSLTKFEIEEDNKDDLLEDEPQFATSSKNLNKDLSEDKELIMKGNSAPEKNAILNKYDSLNEEDQMKHLLFDINHYLSIKLNGVTHDRKKPNQVTVYIYLVFLKIGEIDTVKERFQADAYIESYWDDETIDSKIPFDPRNNWNPQLHIENAIGDLKQEIRYRTRKVNGVCRVHEIRNLKGIFWERLELWDFPLGNEIKKKFE